MDLRQSIVNAAILAALAGGGWFLYQRLVDRGDEIIEAGETTTGSVIHKDVACRGDFRHIRYSYKAGGLSFEDDDKVDCGWEIPTMVTVAYLQDDPKKSRVLSPYRNGLRVNAGR